jgi:sensor histidine kinase YesM
MSRGLCYLKSLSSIIPPHSYTSAHSDPGICVYFNVNRLFGYKLHHLLFWAFYHYCWWTVAMGNPVKAAVAIFGSLFFIKYIFYVVASTACVCLNLYVLMPRYLEKGRIAAYVTWLSACILTTSALILPGYYLTAAAMGQSVRQVFQLGKDPFVQLFFANAFPATLASMTLGMSIKLTNKWIQTRRRQQLLEKEKLESELKFLKYQFNPHFLFNTINSIFFLIHKNPDKASASLAKFSELLRHQLYECNDRQIALAKEISYLENFIQLQRLRQNDDVAVSFQLKHRQADNLDIAPFILMTFVENAFKHVSTHADKPNWINIDLQIHRQELNFSISNSCSSKPVPSNGKNAGVLNGGLTGGLNEPGGIGLSNVRRRLDLLYAGQYRLNIQNNNSSFDVDLQLQLSLKSKICSTVLS